MATLEEIRNRIKRIIQDSAYTDEIIDEFINEGYSRCASSVLLPSLESSGQITALATTPSVQIPDSWNFDRNITMCFTSEGRKINILSSLVMMARTYPSFGVDNEYGQLEACTVVADKFFYYPIPEEQEVLTCTFYQKISTLVDDSAIPTALPDFLHFKLLTSFVCAEIFSEIEDGIDGVQINTKKYMSNFMTAIEELKDFFRVGQSRPEPQRSSQWI